MDVVLAEGLRELLVMARSALLRRSMIPLEPQPDPIWQAEAPLALFLAVMA